jgi:hypothetical protein
MSFFLALQRILAVLVPPLSLSLVLVLLLVLVEGVLLLLVMLTGCFIVHLLHMTVDAVHRVFGAVPRTSVLSFPGKTSHVGRVMTQ